MLVTAPPEPQLEPVVTIPTFKQKISPPLHAMLFDEQDEYVQELYHDEDHWQESLR